MLHTLIIRNFVLIESLTIDFREGFTVITGETGAGKSIILGAIGLLMGQRADSSSIRPGADKCIIEAHFDGVDETVNQILAEEDIEPDNTECIIRREISTRGKSRSFVNDTPASLQLLKRLSEYLIDIHSQHKNLLLGDAHFQLSVLDLYSLNVRDRSAYADSYQRLRASRKALETARVEASEVLKEQDYLQFQYDQLCQAELTSGELASLEEEEKVLSHALDIKTGLSKAFSALDDDEQGALRAIGIALESVQSIRRYYPEAEELYERLHSTRIELDDLAQTLEYGLEAVAYDPQRLQIISERLDLLNGLLLKHGRTSTDELIEYRDSLAERLEAIANSDEHIASLEREVEELRAATETLADILHRQREAASVAVQQALVEGLRELGMPHVRLNIELTQTSELGPSGRDQATFLFSANKEIAPEPVADIASGGEISRLMLCIKALIADRRNLPTIIFDEIDTGVSGDIADRIGAILQQMGRSMQVMAVTHLPQIAAAGTDHYYIYKEHEAETTRSHIRRLSEEERIEEIARMQSGTKLTDISLAAAAELLKTTQNR